VFDIGKYMEAKESAQEVLRDKIKDNFSQQLFYHLIGLRLIACRKVGGLSLPILFRGGWAAVGG